MGDNRLNSEDSRYWGSLDEKMILGKAWVIWWSYEDGDYDYLKQMQKAGFKGLFQSAFISLIKRDGIGCFPVHRKEDKYAIKSSGTRFSVSKG